MQYHALAVDYDNTLATDGHVDDLTVDALRQLRQSGRRLILVTGRCIDPLLNAFSQVRIFDLIVAENGAYIYNPETKEKRLLGHPPPEAFIEQLMNRGVPPLEKGEVIVSTCVPYEHTVLSVVHDQGLDLQIIFNKDAVMILPTGINKATGLRAALTELGLSPHNIVGIGDAENDEAFLELSELSAAVSNALESVKQNVDIILNGACSAGVRELIFHLLANDLQDVLKGSESQISLGVDLSGNNFLIPAYHTRLLITGESGKGKSRLALSSIEQLMDSGYQVCVLDPEGDYQDIPNTIVLGTLQSPPTVDEVMQVLKDPEKSCVVSLFAASDDEQPPAAVQLIHAFLEYRNRTGRPHWTIIDEAHRLFPASYEPVRNLDLINMRSLMLITAFPEQLAEVALRGIDCLAVMGHNPEKILQQYCALTEIEQPASGPAGVFNDRALAWKLPYPVATWFEPASLRMVHLRHRHMYLEGNMHPDNRFYFRGPNGELNLAAQNLKVFLQMAEGVNEETWLYHLHRGDYSRWFRDEIKDEELAHAAETIEADSSFSSKESVTAMGELIRNRYDKVY
jgi:hydroxymethylpyrimidine pyrophosphatase-like HAD family hydrolase